MAPGPGALPIPHVPVTDLGGDYDKRVRTTGVELLVPLHESENSEHLGLIQVGRETLYTELIDDIFPDSAENSVFRTRLAYHIVAGNIDLSGLKVLKGKFLEGRAIEKRDDAESILFQAHNTPAVRPWDAWPSLSRLVPAYSFHYHKT